MLSVQLQFILLFKEQDLLSKCAFADSRSALMKAAENLVGSVDHSQVVAAIFENLESVHAKVLACEMLTEIGVFGLDDKIQDLLEDCSSVYEVALLALALARSSNLRGFSLLEELYRQRLSLIEGTEEEKNRIAVPLEFILDSLEFDIRGKAARKFKKKLEKISA